MPWQQQVVDTALEVDPDSGLLVHDEVDLTVPRQSGKTALLLAVMVERALFHDPVKQRIVYTAQSRKDAREKWEDEHVETLQDTRFGKLFNVRLQNGQEAIRWRNGSRHGLMSTTKKAGHGPTIDLGVIDEAFAQADWRLEQANKPAMITRPEPQLWVVSTAGDEDSIYLWSKVEAGRQRVEAGITRPGVAYFEWSAEEDADPADPATWRTCMPALGITQSEQRVQSHFDSMPFNEFRRAYCNLWPEMGAGGSAMDPEVWANLTDAVSRPEMPIVIAFDVSPDRKWGSIGLAGSRTDDDMDHVEIADRRQGTGWMHDRIIDLVQRREPAAVLCDTRGPAASLIGDLESADVEVTKVNTAQHAQACGLFYDAVEDGTLRHLDDPMLAAAVSSACTRKLSDAFAWDRTSSDADISPLVAVTLALWGHHQRIDVDPQTSPLVAFVGGN